MNPLEDLQAPKPWRSELGARAQLKGFAPNGLRFLTKSGEAERFRAPAQPALVPAQTCQRIQWLRGMIWQEGEHRV
jgi:hypothetical protein